MCPPVAFEAVPGMFGDAALAGMFAGRMLAKRAYLIAFSYPVVP
jgi:hypothetical protein